MLLYITTEKQTEMPLSLNSKIKDIRGNPEAAKQIGQIIPGFTTGPRMKLVGLITFRKLAKIQPGKVTPETLTQIEQILGSLEDVWRPITGFDGNMR